MKILRVVFTTLVVIVLTSSGLPVSQEPNQDDRVLQDTLEQLDDHILDTNESHQSNVDIQSGSQVDQDGNAPQINVENSDVQNSEEQSVPQRHDEGSALQSSTEVNVLQNNNNENIPQNNDGEVLQSDADFPQANQEVGMAIDTLVQIDQATEHGIDQRDLASQTNIEETNMQTNGGDIALESDGGVNVLQNVSEVNLLHINGNENIHHNNDEEKLQTDGNVSEGNQEVVTPVDPLLEIQQAFEHGIKEGGLVNNYGGDIALENDDNDGDENVPQNNDKDVLQSGDESSTTNQEVGIPVDASQNDSKEEVEQNNDRRTVLQNNRGESVNQSNTVSKVPQNNDGRNIHKDNNDKIPERQNGPGEPQNGQEFKRWHPMGPFPHGAGHPFPHGWNNWHGHPGGYPHHPHHFMNHYGPGHGPPHFPHMHWHNHPPGGYGKYGHDNMNGDEVLLDARQRF